MAQYTPVSDVLGEVIFSEQIQAQSIQISNPVVQAKQDWKDLSGKLAYPYSQYPLPAEDVLCKEESARIYALLAQQGRREEDMISEFDEYGDPHRDIVSWLKFIPHLNADDAERILLGGDRHAPPLPTLPGSYVLWQPPLPPGGGGATFWLPRRLQLADPAAAALGGGAARREVVLEHRRGFSPLVVTFAAAEDDFLNATTSGFETIGADAWVTHDLQAIDGSGIVIAHKLVYAVGGEGGFTFYPHRVWSRFSGAALPTAEPWADGPAGLKEKGLLFPSIIHCIRANPGLRRWLPRATAPRALDPTNLLPLPPPRAPSGPGPAELPPPRGDSDERFEPPAAAAAGDRRADTRAFAVDDSDEDSDGRSARGLFQVGPGEASESWQPPSESQGAVGGLADATAGGGGRRPRRGDSDGGPGEVDPSRVVLDPGPGPAQGASSESGAAVAAAAQPLARPPPRPVPRPPTAIQVASGTTGRTDDSEL